jgi:hypothetical protein
MNVSKAQRAFFRKLYLAGLISQQSHSLSSLTKLTGMPRRTIQDTLKDLGDIGISCIFIQTEGARNNSGYYQIDQWGPIDPHWVGQHITELAAVLGVESTPA